MPLIVTAEEILRRAGERPPARPSMPIEEFLPAYRRLSAQGLTHAQIADRLHMAPGTVKKKLSSARKAGLIDWRRTAVAACGTVGGYNRHKQAGEDACESCMKAKAARSRTYRRQRSKAGAR